MLNEQRTTCVHITPVPGMEMDKFMEMLRAFQEGFDVQTTSLDSEGGAWFDGTIKPHEIVTRWFNYDAFPYQWHASIDSIAVHRHSIGSLLSWLYKTHISIDTADGTDAKQFMEVLRKFQEGFGAEVEFFDSQYGAAYLLGDARTVTASRIATEWSDKLPSYLSRRVAKIAVM
ncbi:hypothetical protein KSF_079730 [Reticulibacter mediterranei]|uniref:Uncharacterized protein n=1 Tax=Reticulibacter mediterranei TaxID=2778369 RepID=A0A8J3ISU9_9CHLR|nr:hypothetical protein [Reticulibacter mediterranei]GHO97925.1 hypothetical protein KSF_079730 [Reticulibacter mediterranei]